MWDKRTDDVGLQHQKPWRNLQVEVGPISDNCFNISLANIFRCSLNGLETYIARMNFRYLPEDNQQFIGVLLAKIS